MHDTSSQDMIIESMNGGSIGYDMEHQVIPMNLILIDVLEFKRFIEQYVYDTWNSVERTMESGCTFRRIPHRSLKRETMKSICRLHISFMKCEHACMSHIPEHSRFLFRPHLRDFLFLLIKEDVNLAKRRGGEARKLVENGVESKTWVWIVYITTCATMISNK